MAIPVPASFVDGDLAVAELNTSVFDPLNFLFNAAQVTIQRISGVQLFQGPPFNVVDSITATEDGVAFAYASARLSSVRGNKELRLVLNGDFISDGFIAAQNQFGVATPAFSSLFAGGLVVVSAGDSIDFGVFVDASDSCQVDNGVMGVVWLRN